MRQEFLSLSLSLSLSLCLLNEVIPSVVISRKKMNFFSPFRLPSECCNDCFSCFYEFKLYFLLAMNSLAGCCLSLSPLRRISNLLFTKGVRSTSAFLPPSKVPRTRIAFLLAQLESNDLSSVTFYCAHHIRITVTRSFLFANLSSKDKPLFFLPVPLNQTTPRFNQLYSCPKLPSRSQAKTPYLHMITSHLLCASFALF